MSMTRRMVAFTAACSIAAPLLLGGSPTSAQTTPTDFAFRGSGYSTRVTGGGLPVGSGPSAYTVLACTSTAGLVRQNRVASTNPSGVPVRVGASTTVVRSLALAGGAATLSKNTTASVRVGRNDVTFLEVRGLEITGRAALVDGRSRPTVTYRVGSARLHVLGRPVVALTIGDLRSGVAVPGVGSVRLGEGTTRSGSGFAAAVGTGLVIRVVILGSPDPAVVTVGRVNARIDRAPAAGLVRGSSRVATATSTAGVVQAGPLVYRPHPCLGTGGRWQSTTLVSGDLGDLAQVRTAVGSVWGRPVAGGGFEARGRARVERVVLLGGRLRIDAVIAATNVRSAGGSRTANAHGTSVGRIVFDGRTIAIPAPGQSVTVGGVARITFRSVRMLPRGIDVTAVRVELLGRAVVVELARSVTAIG